MISLASRAAAIALCAATLAVTPSLTAQGVDHDEAANRLRIEIHEAVVTGDETGLAQVVIRARRAVTAFPDDALLNHYLGYALHRLGSMMFEHDPNMAVDMLEESEMFLKHSIEMQPIAESHALVALGLGMRILDDAQVMTLGMQLDAAMGRARALGADNPRVRLVEGISTFHRPEMWGGGHNAALGHFQAAIELFAADDPEPPLPAWGHAEAHAWLGQTYEGLGQVDKARAAYTRALELEPEYAWVLGELLPGLEGDG